jgi:DNA-binding transcriptional LysR family regulator
MDRLAAMETFLRVIETGSFSGAARQMHVGQPAISKTIAQLEDRLGVQLLVRSTRGLAPTEAGQNFYERARHAIEEADEADLAARGAGASLSGRLRVSAGIAFARLHVFPHLASFLRDHPKLEVDILADDRYLHLLEEGIDLALRMGPLEDAALTARKIGECRRLALGTPAYFERAGEPMAPGDLAAHQVIGRPGPQSVLTFRRGAVETSVTVGSRVRVTSGEGIRDAVLAGLGLTMGSEWLFAAELKSGAVRAAMPDWRLPSIELWAVFPSGRRASAKARAFAAFVEAEVRKAVQTEA